MLKIRRRSRRMSRKRRRRRRRKKRKRKGLEVWKTRGTIIITRKL
jgi:hypothetical protein